MNTIRRVSPAEAKKLIDEEGYIYVDVRSEPEYASGHPAGAKNLPFQNVGPGGMQANQDFLPVVQALFPKDAKLILGCRSGQRSLRAAEALLGAGYTDVIDQRAGFDGRRDMFGKLIEPGWSYAGLPVAQATPGGSYAELRREAGPQGAQLPSA
ncbi:rhodanese-like domain-containing protein [Chondromyces crocatus]|uniref:Sulfurtransferase n=1 Tax=Chondromyces crocatus TaxID=52 RepID=A0A0K1E9A1_CHOCO|nr:rhodanese-like domain-containing protein [Chondromyces crocatus]AKT37450.1 sulfurtransferase [Chondromyces crocatus]